MSQTHKTKPLKINQLSLPVDVSQKKNSHNQNRSALCHSANLRKRALTANMKRLDLQLTEEKEKYAKGTEKMSFTVSSMHSPEKLISTSSFSSHLKHFSCSNKNNSWLNENLSVPLHSNSKFHSYSKAAQNQNIEKCKTTNGLETEGSKIDENNNGLSVKGAEIKKEFEYQRPKTTSLNDFVESEKNEEQKNLKNKQNYRNGRSGKESLNVAENYPLESGNSKKDKRILKVYEYKANQINLPSNFTNLLKLEERPKAFPFCKRMSISSVSRHIEICIDEINNKKTNDADNEKDTESSKMKVNEFAENEEHEKKNNNENHTTISSIVSPKRNSTHYELATNTSEKNVFPQFRTPILVATRISSKRQVSFSNEMILRMKEIDEFTKNQNGLIGFNGSSNPFNDRIKCNNCTKISRAQSMKHPQKPKLNECVEEVPFGAWENLENDEGMINNF